MSSLPEMKDFSLAAEVQRLEAKLPSPPMPDSSNEPKLRGNMLTTIDVTLAAFLMMQGAILEAVEQPGSFASFTLTHKSIKRLANDYYTGKMIHFSPKAFAEYRENLKAYTLRKPFAR